jgi:uncharacterized protein YodC (DUF2158 family)
MSDKRVIIRPNKFKVGDEVLVDGSMRMTVKKVILSSSGASYLCENYWRLDVYAEHRLRFQWNNLKESKPPKTPPPKCPRCNNDWHTSGMGTSIWKDCLKCKIKAEDC